MACPTFAFEFLGELQETVGDFSRLWCIKGDPWVGVALRRYEHRVLRKNQGNGFASVFVGSPEDVDHRVFAQSLTVTVFISVYCCSPYSPNSLPTPDCLNPPNGARVSRTL
jgi:hypothetical protein